jgi:hypothetical protein
MQTELCFGFFVIPQKTVRQALFCFMSRFHSANGQYIFFEGFVFFCGQSATAAGPLKTLRAVFKKRLGSNFAPSGKFAPSPH